MRVDRRDFLSSSLAAGGVVALHGLAARLARSSTGRESLRAKEVAGGYGPLHPSKAANADEALLKAPDNLCVSPRGGLVICEDGRGAQHLRGLADGGQIFDLAVNVVPGFENMEFAGTTFSPDGQTLFVNIQAPGLTFAIWGPWEAGAL